MSSIPPLTVLRDALVRRIQAIKNGASLLNPVDIDRVNTLLNTLQTNIPTTTSLTAAAVLTPNGTCGLNPIKALSSSNPLDYSAFQFGQGNLGWSFLYGNMGSVGFTLMFFRVELSTPHILKEMDISPEQGVIYSICAGFGERGGKWTTMPPTNVQGIYASEDQGFDFQAVSNPDNPWLKLFTFSQKQGLTSVNIQWNSKNTDGTEVLVGYNAILTPLKPAVYQGPKGCMPCIGGQGTLYWSFPSMHAQGSVGLISSPTVSSGTGWYDHQWLATGGMLSNRILQLLSVISSTISTPKVIRWLWLTLQLPNDVQYMISIILNDLPQQGKTYNTTAVTKIDGTSVSYKVSGTAKIESMAQIGAQSYPNKYTIILEGQTYTLQTAFGNSGVYLPSGVLNWEGPGDVLDSSGNVIGSGFLEANQLDTAQNLQKTQGQRAGISPSELSTLTQKRTNPLSGILALIIIALTLSAFIFLAILSGKGIGALARPITPGKGSL